MSETEVKKACTIRVKITDPAMAEISGRPDLQVWFASGWKMAEETPAQAVARFNRLAKRLGSSATYELATEEQYWEYRNRT
jgi:hypothetical protein